MNLFIEKIEKQSDKSLFLILFFVAFAVRIYASFTSIAQLYPDEIFQTVEVAHKLVFGKGHTFWEFRAGARSWFFPGILAGVYKCLDFFGVTDGYYLNVGIKIFLGFFHSLAISVVYLLFRRWCKTKFVAFLFTLPLALNFMLAYISARTLTEAIALPFMVFTLYQATIYVETYKLRNLIFTIVLAGIAYMLRFQTAVFSFGIAISFLFASKKHLKTSLLFGFGFIGMMMIQGVLDMVTWGSFMHSLTTYLDYNINKGIANEHGVFPWYYYIKEFSSRCYPITTVTAFLTTIYLFISPQKKKEILFFFPFLFFFIVHSLVPHKEPRFVFPFYIALLALSSLFFALLYEKFGKKRVYIALLAFVVIIASYTVSTIKFRNRWNASIVYLEFWDKKRDRGYDKIITGNIEIGIALGRIKDLKKAFVYGVSHIWSGGYAYFHKDASIYYTVHANEMTRFIRNASNSKSDGSYFAIRKGHEKKFTRFKNILVKVKETENFAIFILKSSNQQIKISYSALPKKTRMGSRWDAGKNVVMGKKGVLVTFNKLQMASMIKIALDSSDRYRIIFLKNKKVIAVKRVHQQRHKRGIFVHPLTLPTKVQMSGFDAIEITPEKGDNAYSLGSITIVTMKTDEKL
jgi:hypothetical protein